MNNVVINMPSNHIRRAHIEKEFGKHNIPFRFFNAVSPENNLNLYSEKLLPQIKNTILTNGEKGCLLSHLVLWQECINNNEPYIAIFEDDILLSRNAHLFLNHDNWLKDRFDLTSAFLLRFETFLMPVEQENTIIEQVGKYKFTLLKSIHFGTAGYIISQQLAKDLLRYFQQQSADKIQSIDNWLFNNDLFKSNHYFIYQQNPAICIQELQYNQSDSILQSSIQNERKKRDKKYEPKKTIKERISKINYNIVRALSFHRKKKVNSSKKKIESITLFK